MSIDPVFAHLQRDIESAKEAIISLAQKSPYKWWRAYELKMLARNKESAGAMSLALTDLIDQAVFKLEGPYSDKMKLSQTSSPRLEESPDLQESFDI